MSQRSSARPICQACNRPFDPRSPGATRNMGPTCAKRSGLVAGEERGWQLSFGESLGESKKPPRPKFRSRLPKRSLPPELREGFLLAKMAFDELFREFCNNGTLLHNENALELESELRATGCEVHSLADPVLGWLDPEHQLQLLIDRENHMAYHRREINEVVTMLAIDPAESVNAGRYIRDISEFTSALRRHHQGEQLSLIEL